MEFPFFKTDKEWQELRPKEIDLIGQSDDLDPTQKKFLDVFRVADLRVEWNCKLSVLHHNWMVLLTAFFFVLEGPKIVGAVTAYFIK